MTQKTYGVRGLMELVVVVTLGSRNFKIPFTGGSTSSRGIMPATYTTDNEIVQLAIESSPEYASGRIQTLKTIEKEAAQGGASPAAESQPSDVAKAPLAESEAPIVKTFSDRETLKDWLVETYNVSRSKIRTKEQQEAFALEHNIELRIES